MQAPVVVASEGGVGQPQSVSLGVYPNPLQGVGTVVVEVQRAGHVRVSVVDVLGREVALVSERLLPVGQHELALDSSRLVAGLYVVRLEAGGEGLTRRLIVVR